MMLPVKIVVLLLTMGSSVISTVMGETTLVYQGGNYTNQNNTGPQQYESSMFTNHSSGNGDNASHQGSSQNISSRSFSGSQSQSQAYNGQGSGSQSQTQSQSRGRPQPPAYSPYYPSYDYSPVYNPQSYNMYTQG